MHSIDCFPQRAPRGCELRYVVTVIPFDSPARCYTGDTLRFTEERGPDDAESHRGDVGFLLHCAGDGGWSGLAGHPLLGAGELLMRARQMGVVEQRRGDQFDPLMEQESDLFSCNQVVAAVN